MEESTLPKYIAAAFWAIVVIAPIPGLAVYLAWISELEQYGYVFPLLLALAALILFRWDYRFRMPDDWFSLGLVGLAVVSTFLAAYRASPWLSAIAFVLAVTAWLRGHRSSEPDGHRLTYLALLLLMLIRLPLNLDLALAASLQRATSRISSHMLDSFGVTHYLRGNVIELPGGTLFVEEACSGVQSLFTVLFLACLWIVFRRRPILATPAYLLAGVGWAMVMNVVRITSIALAQEWYSLDLSEGLPHEILGWICLALAVIMMLSTDRLLRVAFYPVPPDESGHLGNPVARLWNWALAIGVPQESDEFRSDRFEMDRWTLPTSKQLATVMMVVVSIICLPSLALSYRVVATRFESSSEAGSKPLLWNPGPTLMNKTSYAAQITNHQSLRDANSKQLGNHADVWTVVIDGMAVRIAVSQPYPEWHDMRLCYTGNGWQVNDWKPLLELADSESQTNDMPTDSGTPDSLNNWPTSYAEMIRDTGEFGTLLFCGLTSQGDLLAPPMSGLYSLFDDRIKDRASLRSNIIMLQLWTETQKPLIPEQLENLQRLFDAFRETVLAEFGNGPTPINQDANVTMISAGGPPR